MKKSDDYLWDRSGEDPEVARLEQLLSPLRHDAPLDELRLRRPKSRRSLLIGSMVAVAATIALIAWWSWPGDRPQQVAACAGSSGFSFTSKGGDVACNGAAVASGVLPVNGTLDTGDHEAELKIANIGSAQLGARTRVRLEHTGDRHQLFLEQGRMHALVSAPPRIFAVATPSTQVTDLGCEYTLDIGPDGAGTIHVITGKVELETGTGVVVVAHAGTTTRLLPGRHASVPLSDKAGEAIKKAVAELDAGAPDALAHVLAAATLEDALTIATLARMVSEAKRRSVLETLQTLVKAPQDTTIDEALADSALLDMWFLEVELVQIGAAQAH